ncbi:MULTISPECIES: GntR family transcriptional regulator [Xanthomonas]|uniref:GntR family transcriptional regulator n=1 Tax=Xanthomonas cucurbitae TaxID=56453 RepID=A0A2S7DRR1_9XANT|nr:GntR family transcriptional regulator [Xanthomonas cucurbitae]PPU76484.1 GntR family transcriptional regulator [Xanthomonas cucurbitae]QHG88049.1 GntR family transcriptional regulator [Xanthomonas cucurbitae]WDM66911.1 GntR family transcriptional regulator [Xanthomonas cucurbitae]WDM70788.1 GntR family transcriptional regulator [Xanthomonas cucurbitae]WDM74605.1 GntR family transcriptional regulator [Xanthomonas cucurbitae]
MNLRIDHTPVTLREKCQEKLRNAIITGYFPSGARLVERTLCEQLGVSRSVVREVIRYLQAEGLVEILPQKGPIVAVLNWNVANQVYRIRMVMEQAAVADCVRNLTDESASDIMQALERLRLSYDSPEIANVLEALSALYETIFRVGNNPIAWEIVQRLNGRISRLRAMTMTHTAREKTGFERIRAICEAICVQRDDAAARDRVAEHIREAQAIAYTLLEGEPR